MRTECVGLQGTCGERFEWRGARIPQMSHLTYSSLLEWSHLMAATGSHGLSEVNQSFGALKSLVYDSGLV